MHLLKVSDCQARIHSRTNKPVPVSAKLPKTVPSILDAFVQEKRTSSPQQRLRIIAVMVRHLRGEKATYRVRIESRTDEMFLYPIGQVTVVPTDAAGIHNGSNLSPDVVPPLLIGRKGSSREETRSPCKHMDGGYVTWSA
jgi:hypothetical protein